MFFFFNVLKERSPEQLIQMTRTLPPLGDHFLKSSLRVSSNTTPLCFSATSHPKAVPVEERHHEKGELSPHFVTLF